MSMDKRWEIALKVMAKMATGNGFCTAYVWGPPGIGKTWCAYETAKRYYAITLTEETPASELRGFYMPKGGGIFEWEDGCIIRAMREGSRVVLNEISHAGPDVLSFLYPILESKGTCRITLPNGETVVSAKGFHVIGTDNYAPDDLPDALQDRWNVTLELRSYSPGGIAGLSDRVRAWANRVEIAELDGRWISLRAWYSIESGLRQGFTLEECCELVFGVDRGQLVYNGIAAADVQANEIAGQVNESQESGSLEDLLPNVTPGTRAGVGSI